MIRRIVAATIAGATIALLLTAPASAATLAQKLSVLSGWTQPTSSSYNSWNSARLNQGAWSDYGFTWSTDYCSASPDQPAGFDFRLPCHRHDFGYRNYNALGSFAANKSRLDDAFYVDLKAKCGTYNVFVRPACLSLAWTYYQAVRAFGSAASVSSADIARAEKLKADGLAAMAAASAS